MAFGKTRASVPPLKTAANPRKRVTSAVANANMAKARKNLAYSTKSTLKDIKKGRDTR